MADPLVMADLLRETRLDAIYRLARVVCVAEPRSIVRLVETLPAVASQIRAADVVLLNKVDLHDEPALVAAEAAIRSVRPDAPVVRCVRSETDIEPFGDVSAAVALHGDLAPCLDPHFVTTTVPVTLPLDPQRLADALGAAESSWFRVKGYVPVNGGMAHFDYSATGATWREAPSTMPSALVLIAPAMPVSRCRAWSSVCDPGTGPGGPLPGDQSRRTGGGRGRPGRPVARAVRRPRKTRTNTPARLASPAFARLRPPLARRAAPPHRFPRDRSAPPEPAGPSGTARTRQPSGRGESTSPTSSHLSGSPGASHLRVWTTT